MKFVVPPLTRACLVMVIGLSLLNALARYSQYSNLMDQGESVPDFSKISPPFLTLVPSQFLIYPWVLVTSSFVEQSVAGFVFTLATILFAGRYCERLWGGRQLAKFLAIQVCVPSAVSVLIIYFIFVFTRASDENVGALVNQPIYGGIALQLGFLVAFKQMLPEHSIVFLHDMGRIQVKYLTFPILTFYTILSIALRRPAMATLAWGGFLTSWIYLRFYRISYVQNILPVSESTESAANQTKIRGDPSDSFAFAKFFYPAVLSDAIAAICDPIYSLLVSLHLCTSFSEEDKVLANPATLRSLPGTSSKDDLDSERRRALALKVLNDRLQTSQATSMAAAAAAPDIVAPIPAPITTDNST